ncbi:MAG: lipoate--protein ligase [Bacteroidales bacterium]|jgi:lipoate-protein ligase A|nr:lipoate--protein ligase [Bacteroidales bacterium]
MLIIQRRSTDPYFNLATEEYVLKHFEEDSFMLWRNAPSIIVGQHQNTLAEINVDYVKKQNIPVVRRLSGGGAVFHDLGNLNFTFIKIGKQENLIDFRKYTLPILEVIQKMGIDAKFEGRNDLTIDGKKFSGNAEHIWKNRILHHGTLLFSSQMSNLTQALNADPLKFQDKSVKSVRSRVTNISEHLKETMDVMRFADLVQAHVVEKYPDARIIELTKEDQDNIHELVRSKYGAWEWNFGYSPNYNFRKILRTKKSGTLEFDLDVQNGVILHLKIFGDYFNKMETGEIEAALTGIAHQEKSIREALKRFKMDDYFAHLTKKEFLQGLF